MGNLWIRFGCFLTGYNFHIVRNSSEVANKAVKKYTSAMLIVCILWSFIGYTFTQRYLHGGLWGAVAGAVIMVIIIVQIERQIILTLKRNVALYIFRGLIALMMAVIGAIIIDQIIFKDDIDLEKMTAIEERVNEQLPSNTADLKNQIAELDSSIAGKEAEKKKLIDDINARPSIKNVTTQTHPIVVEDVLFDSLNKKITKQRVEKATAVQINNIPNPNIALIPEIDTTLKMLRTQKADLGEKLINIRPALKAKIESKTGFLDELKVMYRLIRGSNVAMFVWFIWFFFLVALEMLVLVSKAKDSENDYERTVMHQMNHQLKKLELLSKMAQKN